MWNKGPADIASISKNILPSIKLGFPIYRSIVVKFVYLRLPLLNFYGYFLSSRKFVEFRSIHGSQVRDRLLVNVTCLFSSCASPNKEKKFSERTNG
jgi:hypothetical protein